MTARLVAALLAGAAVAALGALVLGEYEFVGIMPFGAGPLFGLVVAEAVVGVGRRREVGLAMTSAVLAGLGLLWAGWIDSGEGLEPLPVLVWPAIALGVLVAALRVGPWLPQRRRRRPGAAHRS